MDRNRACTTTITICTVALRKESVDRNLVGCINRAVNIMSLSARRAWIEILALRLADMSGAVALRKESVDRNRISGYLVGVYS